MTAARLCRTWAGVIPANWPCGHERTEANTQSVGRGGQVRCRTCRRVIAKESAQRRRVHKRGPHEARP